ncbi:hypothetical protein AB0912_12870 [Streptomyces sp. NPDC007084]|uniref:hypothetical protein n=1 Tax=Streptomyces sp. NPDC007084 TaxID=3154313 RepID=UPI003456CC73
MTEAHATSDVTVSTTLADPAPYRPGAVGAPMKLWGVVPVAAAVALSLAGCSSPHSDSARPDHTSSRASRPDTTTAPTTPSAPAAVIAAPRLDPDEIPAAHIGTRTGNAELPYKAGRKGYALVVAVSCQGDGKLKVRLTPAHTSFALRCGKTVDTTYNQLHLTGAEKPGTVSVTASSNVKWALTIGRKAPTQQEG